MTAREAPTPHDPHHVGILRHTEPQSVAVQRLMPIAGPASMAEDRDARLTTVSPRPLRRTPRA